MNNLTLIKLGGSLITDKSKPLTAKIDVIERIATEIHQARTSQALNLVVGHGGGSFPHKFAKVYQTNLGLINKESLTGVSLVQNAASQLNRLVVEKMIKAGENAVSIQPSSALLARNGRITNWNLDAMEEMLKLNLLPVPYGDVAIDLEKGCCIISTEEVLSYIAKQFGVKRIIIAMTKRGVLKDQNDPSTVIPEINSKNYSEIKQYLHQSEGIDVTGGMLHKVERLFELTKMGIEAELIDGNEAGFVRRALCGEKGLGTTLKA